MKRCFKCGAEKDIAEFYAHPRMADGHLGKCKDCTKADSESRRIEKRKDPKWAEAEAARHRAKQRRYRELGAAAKTSPENRKEWRKRNPHKNMAHSKVNSAVRCGILSKPSVCSDCGKQTHRLHGHHTDYSKPLDVVWVCTTCHGIRHWKIQPNQNAA